MQDQIIIRSLTSIDAILNVNEIARTIWSADEVIPLHQTLTAVKNGGLVLGAYLAEQLIGFQYSFAGFNGSETYLCSHMLAVLPEHQHLGVGEIMKRYQRNQAIKLGYQLITWTYDPLESVNGYLNIGKLGAVSSKYIENCYGVMKDNINAGLPTDRLLVEWRISTNHVSKKLAKSISVPHPQSQEIINPFKIKDEEIAYISDIFFDKTTADSFLYVAIPQNFQIIKQYDLTLAQEWRIAIRNILTHYFSAGWTLTDYYRTASQPINYYVLQKDFQVS
ncbi:MAG: hypothetical protein ACOWWO_09145 [Peptococcaceae bacterium]